MKRDLKRLGLAALILIAVGVIRTGFHFSALYFDSGKEDRIRKEELEKSRNIVNDVTGLNPVQTLGVIVPHTTEEIQEAVRTHARVSIGGGRNSMGGQTASEKAVQIDMREFNKVLSFSTSTKEITVQAGIRWYDIQKVIDPYDLSVKIMQTYSNFTVGGSLSVNVHGRYIEHGPIIMSVKKFEIVLADGSRVVASPTENPDIFYAAIGGMGGIGVITEVTLALDDNVTVERSRVKMPITEYKDYFVEQIKESSDVVFHNGDIYPMDFDSVSAVNWKKTEKETTTETRLIPRTQDYWIERIAWEVMSEWHFGKQIREYILEPILYSKEAVHTRNYEASYDIAELEPQSREASTYVLQEFFVPVEKFDEFYPKMKEVFIGNNVNLLNVSIRYAKQDPGAKLAWAQKGEVFAFVVYYKQGTDLKSKDHVARWTREMIDQVLSVGGTYYLPYQPHATEEQFFRAYPGAVDFFDIKKVYDPTNKFTNKLWDKYYDPGQMEKFEIQRDAQTVASSTKDYYRFSDNMFLSLPEWYIVYSAGEYSAVLEGSLPSQFDYCAAVGDYWKQYSDVQKLTRGTAHQNDNYMLVLKVIGASFTLENGVKWMYENTIGKLSELIAGNKQVEEDIFAAQMNREYEKFIYDYPWYDFPYAQTYEDLKHLKHPNTHSLGEKIRIFERRMFLKLELNAKRFYSWVIRKATQAKFGVQDDVISAVTLEKAKLGLLTAPHYHPFTKALLEKFESVDVEGGEVSVVQIAGNTDITFVYLDEVGAAILPGMTEVLRDKEVQSILNGKEVAKDRITVLAKTTELFNLYKKLKEKRIRIEHFYDY